MNKIAYPQESIEKLLLLLNNIEIKSIDNAKRIVMIENILQSGELFNEPKQDLKTDDSAKTELERG